MRQRSSGPKGESISLPLTRRLDPTSRSAFPVLLSLSLPLSLSRHYARERAVSPLYNELPEIYVRSVSLGSHITGQPIIFNYPARARARAYRLVIS